MLPGCPCGNVILSQRRIRNFDADHEKRILIWNTGVKHG
jgi:hypothetical protein